MGKSQKPSIIHTIGVSGVIRLAYRISRSYQKNGINGKLYVKESIVTHKTENFPYCTINSREWLSFCGFVKLNVNPNIPEPGPMVFDSRSPQVAHGGLTQEFVGQTIEVKKNLYSTQEL